MGENKNIEALATWLTQIRISWGSDGIPTITQSPISTNSTMSTNTHFPPMRPILHLLSSLPPLLNEKKKTIFTKREKKWEDLRPTTYIPL